MKRDKEIGDIIKLVEELWRQYPSMTLGDIFIRLADKENIDVIDFLYLPDKKLIKIINRVKDGGFL